MKTPSKNAFFLFGSFFGRGKLWSHGFSRRPAPGHWKLFFQNFISLVPPAKKITGPLSTPRNFFWGRLLTFDVEARFSILHMLAETSWLQRGVFHRVLAPAYSA